VLAHYRTEPDDLARLLDAPNLAVRALVHDGHVAAVALLAEEGGLDDATRSRIYRGERVAGNMVPDLLTAQLRDRDAAGLRGLRVVRIATHPAARRRGLGSRLLSAVADEFDHLDDLGTGFGATPGLVGFWRENGYGVVHLSTSRNEASGEYSALLLCPVSEAGRSLHDRHAARFAGRVGAMCSDPLRDADPDVVRAALRATRTAVEPDLAPHEWTLLASAGAGPAHLSTNPGPFRALVVAHLVAPAEPTALAADSERALVMRVLQARPADEVAGALGYPSGRQAMRAVGEAVATLVRLYGPEAAREELERYG